MKRPDHNTPLNFTEKYKSRISLIISVVTLVILCLCLRQIDKILIQEPQKKQEEQQKLEEEQQKLAEAEPDIYTASFVAVGDNRFSDALISSGYNEETDSYNYDSVYAQVSQEISSADFAIVNQETVFTEDSSSFTGEDTFASPTAVGDALVNAGFDGIASATNHMDDFGSSMITETLNYWNTSHPDVHVLGIHASETDAGNITVVEINQIRIALLDYTSSTYTGQLGDEESYMIDQLDQTAVAADISAAKSSSDCIIVIANWGNEEDEEVGNEQKEWANFLLSQGVLVTIGMNPRVVQPYETITDSSGHSMLVYYSLGNFVSTQNMVPRLLEGMATFTIEKSVPKDTTQPATIRVTTSSLEPMVMHYNYDENIYAVYMLDDYTEDLAASHSIHDLTEEEFTLSSLQAQFTERTSGSVLGTGTSAQNSADTGANTNTNDTDADTSGSDDSSDLMDSGTSDSDDSSDLTDSDTSGSDGSSDLTDSDTSTSDDSSDFSDSDLSDYE